MENNFLFATDFIVGMIYLTKSRYTEEQLSEEYQRFTRLQTPITQIDFWALDQILAKETIQKRVFYSLYPEFRTQLDGLFQKQGPLTDIEIQTKKTIAWIKSFIGPY